MSQTLAVAIDEALRDIAKKLDAKVSDSTIEIRHLQKGGTRVKVSFLIKKKSDLKSSD